MIPELIFHWAKRAPNKTAIIYNGNEISYSSFARHIALARGYFAKRGYLGPGYAVIAVDDLSEVWVLSLALRSLGLTAMVVPSAAVLDALGLPDVRCVITTPTAGSIGLDTQCTARGPKLLSVSLGDEAPLELGAPGSPYPTGGHILATSGTTGSYKKLLMSPAIDAVLLQRKVEAIGMNEDTVLSVFRYPAWTAVGYRWAASPWAVGGTTLIEQGDGPWQALLRPGITHAVMVPYILAATLNTPAGTFPRNEALKLIVGGGPMTRTQIDQAKARITPQLFNWLASTEAGGIALTRLDTPEDHKWQRLVPGRVVEIVDESGRVLPTGETGRVRVRTAGGPTSYLDDETATRAFFKDGFFYPGDLAVMRSDGRIALQGRVTDVIIRQGGKISPKPIEDRLIDILGVGGVCLFSKQGDSGEEEAYLVIETRTPFPQETLTAVLNQELQWFPRAHVYYLASLPRNPMGKVLRQALRAQTFASRPSASLTRTVPDETRPHRRPR